MIAGVTPAIVIEILYASVIILTIIIAVLSFRVIVISFMSLSPFYKNHFSITA